MVLLDSIKSFAWECIFACKLVFSFLKHLVCSVAILTLCESIPTTSSNDFQLVSIFLYSTSNSVFSTYKWFGSTKITVSLSWWVGSWAWYSSFLAKDLSNQICILAKFDLVNSSAWIIKSSCQTCICAWHNLFFKRKTSTFALKQSLNATSFLVLVASKACHNVPIVCT